MILKGINNQKLELKIVNYQFPKNTTSDLDANWLNIYFNIESDFGNWHTTDSCLMTSEFKELIKWFENLSLNQNVEHAQLYFTEPNLEFHLINSKSDVKHIRVVFNAELKPQSAKDGQEYFMDFKLSSEELSEIACDFDRELTKYPER